MTMEGIELIINMYVTINDLCCTVPYVCSCIELKNTSGVLQVFIVIAGEFVV